MFPNTGQLNSVVTCRYSYVKQCSRDLAAGFKAHGKYEFKVECSHHSIYWVQMSDRVRCSCGGLQKPILFLYNLTSFSLPLLSTPLSAVMLATVVALVMAFSNLGNLFTKIQSLSLGKSSSVMFQRLSSYKDPLKKNYISRVPHVCFQHEGRCTDWQTALKNSAAYPTHIPPLQLLAAAAEERQQ